MPNLPFLHADVKDFSLELLPLAIRPVILENFKRYSELTKIYIYVYILFIINIVYKNVMTSKLNLH